MSIELQQIKTPNGIVLWKGQSPFNGEDVVAIATGFNGSQNPKTGDMIQVWILQGNENPNVAYMGGKDDTVCGDCKHRSVKNGGLSTCYVSVHQAPNNIYKSYRKGNYDDYSKEIPLSLFAGKKVRWGAYGEPTVIPLELISKVNAVAAGHTAYTHQWAKPEFQEYKSVCMASVDSPKEYKKARALGWRTFRLLANDEQLDKGEFACPASEEAGKKRTCFTCMACDGSDGNPKKAVVAIKLHGRSFKIKRFNLIRKLQDQKKKWKHILTDLLNGK